jgi:hypothetical protein
MLSANVDTSASVELIAAPTAGFIRVLGLDLQAASAVVATLKSDGTSGTAKHTIQFTSANLRDCLPVSKEGWMDCAATKNLYLTLGSGVRVTGVVRYAIYGS